MLKEIKIEQTGENYLLLKWKNHYKLNGYDGLSNKPHSAFYQKQPLSILDKIRLISEKARIIKKSLPKLSFRSLLTRK